MHDSHYNGLSWFLTGCVVVFIAVVTLRRRGYLGTSKQLIADSEADSAIISFYTNDHLLSKAGEGMLGDLHYASYATTPAMYSEHAFDATGIAVINVLDLPFNTETHLIGLSKQHGIDRHEFAAFAKSKGMEPVVLEGDFQDNFDLYAPAGEQVDVRRVLTPKAMEYVVDYCRSHFWEINRAELYFVLSTDDKVAGDIFQEAGHFVEQLKPALTPGEPGAAVVHHQVAYGEYDGPALNCPVCAQPMTSNGLWHVCPTGQGVLISGRELGELHRGTLTIPADPTLRAEHGPLTCPNCQNQMVPVNYEATGVQIDSCEHCPYRWLDANEIMQLCGR